MWFDFLQWNVVCGECDSIVWGVKSDFFWRYGADDSAFAAEICTWPIVSGSHLFSKFPSNCSNMPIVQRSSLTQNFSGVLFFARFHVFSNPGTPEVFKWHLFLEFLECPRIFQIPRFSGCHAFSQFRNTPVFFQISSCFFIRILTFVQILTFFPGISDYRRIFQI